MSRGSAPRVSNGSFGIPLPAVHFAETAPISTPRTGPFSPHLQG